MLKKSHVIGVFALAFSLEVTGYAASTKSDEAIIHGARLKWSEKRNQNIIEQSVGFSDEVPVTRNIPDEEAVNASSFCYQGDPLTVCPQIKQITDASWDRYFNDGYPYALKFKSCKVLLNDGEGHAVEAKYTIINDYVGHFKAVRIIKSCGT